MSHPAAWASVVFALLGAFIFGIRCVMHWRRRRDMPDLIEFLTHASAGAVVGVGLFTLALILLGWLGPRFT